MEIFNEIEDKCSWIVISEEDGGNKTKISFFYGTLQMKGK